MKIFYKNKTSSEFANHIADQFIEEINVQTQLEELYRMGKNRYFQDLHFRVAGEPVEFYTMKRLREEPRLIESPNLWCGKYKRRCQQAFINRLIELVVSDEEILLAIMTLRPKAWGNIKPSSVGEGVWKIWWNTSTTEIVECVRPSLPHISKPISNPRDHWHHLHDSVHIMRREMWERYSLDLHFGGVVRNAAGLELAKKLQNFKACRLAYITAHSGDIGTQLLKRMCATAQKTAELRFVVNSVFDQGEKGPNWEKLKSLLSKLTASLK